MKIMTEPADDDVTALMIDQACANGLKRGQSYPIEFAFFGDRDQLDQLRTEMLASGYKEDTSQTDEMLIVVRPLPFELDHIRSAKAKMLALAIKYGVAFDGWSVDVR
jgi:hypothetical protein